MTSQQATKIEDNRVVGLSYTLTDADGAELDRASSDDPLLYLHGHDNIVPGLEAALAGREVGDRFEVELAPEDAFGERLVDAERVVPRDAFPEELELSPGLELALEEDGELIPFWIKRADADRVVIDLNHPFAGRTVRFTGEVLTVREATADELEHGHPHGPDGHAEH
ncbi:MAG TPA: peptidylprolyl isomerase [Sandaracinaceae bacterium]